MTSTRCTLMWEISSIMLLAGGILAPWFAIGFDPPPRGPQAISVGTYAHRLPVAVVFGPALPSEAYDAQQPDESLLLTSLMRNVEILTNTMVEFGL